jgi:hypothetical protein
MKPLSKDSIGVIIALLLVILLSESRLFNFFSDTYLGRTFLIIMVLCASYLNKILGVVSVFIIVIMFCIVKINFEGFENADSTKENKDSGNESMPQTTTSDKVTKPIDTPTQVVNDSDDKDKINVVTTETTNNKKEDKNSDNTDVAIEGFDLQTTENNIRRGKQSNSIPVNQYNNQSIEVAPHESSSFSNFFGFL